MCRGVLQETTSDGAISEHGGGNNCTICQARWLSGGLVRLAKELTGSEDIVHNKDLLALLDAVCLDLERVLSIFLLVGHCVASARHLARLAHRDEGNAQAQREGWAEEKATGIKAYDDIGLVGRKGFLYLVDKHIEKGGEYFGASEYGQDVNEVDTGSRPIGVVL